MSIKFEMTTWFYNKNRVDLNMFTQRSSFLFLLTFFSVVFSYLLYATEYISIKMKATVCDSYTRM